MTAADSSSMPSAIDQIGYRKARLIEQEQKWDHEVARP